MPATTSGQISVTPVLIRANVPLEAIADAIERARYTGQPGVAGWGSVHDETDKLQGQVLVSRPSGGVPEFLPGTDRYPAQVRSRLYWDEPDRTLTRAFGATERGLVADRATTSRFRAADITVAETDRPGEFVGLLGERNEQRLRGQVVPALEEVLASVDPGFSIARDLNPLGFADEDFFRWLLYRATHAPDLDDRYELVEIYAIANQDLAYRSTSMSRGVELDRPELLALIAGESNRFGPAKFSVWCKELSLYISLEVRSSGQFAIYRGRSEYDLDFSEEPLSHEEVGLRLVQDAAFTVLPDIKLLHHGDTAWTADARAAFAAEARDNLKQVLDNL